MIKREINDAVEFKDMAGDWVPGVLTSGRVKDEQGRYGYYVKAGKRKAFAYTKFVRTPK